MIRAAPQLASAIMFHHRTMGRYAQVFYLMVVLLFSIAILATCEVQVEHVGCKSYRDNSDSNFQDVISGENLGFGSDLEPRRSESRDNVCRDSNLFCFRSTLPGQLPIDHVEPKSAEVSGARPDATSYGRSNHMRTNISWSSNCGIIKFSSGRTISCSLKYLECFGERGEGYNAPCRVPLLDHKSKYVGPKKHVRMQKSGNLDDSSPSIEISPTLLDWGQQNLYFPSLAFLTVKNTHADNVLTIYEPYSTNSQFYPCNSSEIWLEPGEAVSICFVFFPAWLGLSSAQLVLQTSSGGFLIQATGFAVESPYKIQPLLDLDVASSGKWRKNLSLFNPFNDVLYVEEVVAWISVSSGNTSQSTKAICSINSFEDQHELNLLAVNEWIDVKSSEADLPLVSMKPHRNWEVGPLKTETIMELDFSFPAKGNFFGAICMQLQRSSKDVIETVMVPLEAEHGGNSAYIEHGSPISISLQALVPHNHIGTIIVNLSVKNDAPYVLRVVKISEVGESRNLFHIKYIEGLILFPGTITQIASISFLKLDPSSELSGMDKNCELQVLTNDSTNAEIKVPCRDIVHVFSSHMLESSVGSVQGSEDVGSDDIIGKPSSSAKQPLLLNEALNSPEVDELVLKNWKSRATASDMSVLDGNEVLFPVVRVGSHSSEFVMVKNPSDQPVVVQLILHSGEIIDECKAVDGPFQAPSYHNLIGYEAAPPRYGFSIAEGALTEALVHPHGRASLGPLLFQPSDRCGWRSSVLVRNNLSGVEWLTVRGIGGSFSMVLVEESELVQSLDFKLSVPAPHTFTSLDIFHHMEENIHACLQPLSKELYAKNIGELPLEIRGIKVSGTECGLDGFAVQNCKGFVLEPGDSIKLTIKYQADFSVATIHRDLELALATGILVIPMKASLPLYMLGFCKKTIFWMRVKKSTITILVGASIVFVVVCCFLSYVMTFGQCCLFKSGKSSISTVTQAGKSSCPHQSHERYGKLAFSARMNGLLKSMGEEEESLLMESINVCNDDPAVLNEQSSSLTAKPVESVMVFGKMTSCLKDTEKGATSSSPEMTNSVAVESSDTQETSQAGNLKVKTGKDKGRRRRKKKTTGNGVTGLFEVSSSQSGNSTPSSPLSPVSSLTPKRSRPLSPDVNHSSLSRNPFGAVAIQRCERSCSSEPKSRGNVLQSEISPEPCGKTNQAWGICTQEKLDSLPKMPGKPVLLPSAILQSAGRPDSRPSFLASASTIAPHARAPGSRLYEQKAVKNEGKADLEEKFRYDIWGDHIFGLPLMGESRDTSRLLSNTTENNSDSFFVRGPQTLKTIAQPEPVNGCDEAG